MNKFLNTAMPIALMVNVVAQAFAGDWGESMAWLCALILLLPDNTCRVKK